MNNKQWTTVIVVAAVLVIAIVLGGIFLNRKKDIYTGDWTPRYKYNRNKEPYDVDVARALLKSAVGKDDFHTLPDTGTLAHVLPEGTSNCYFFIGRNYNLTFSEKDALYDFISRGNTVVLVAESLNEPVKSLLFGELYDYGEYRASPQVMATGHTDTFTLGPVGSYHSSLPVTFRESLVISYRKFYYLDSLLPERRSLPPGFTELQEIAGYGTCFVRVEIGEGQVYLHTVPMAFSNVHMKDERYFEHFNGVLSNIHPVAIYWDNHERKDDTSQDDPYESEHKSEFSYLVSQPELKFVLYLVIFGVLAYLLFAMKREQRPIPPVDTNRNMSVQSLRMVARLFYLHPNHKELTNIRMTIFLHFIRSRYGISTNELDMPFYDKLSTISGVRKDLVRSIFVTHQRLGKIWRVKSEDIISFSDKMNRFYRECK